MTDLDPAQRGSPENIGENPPSISPPNEVNERGSRRWSWKKVALAGAIYGVGAFTFMLGTQTLVGSLENQIPITLETTSYFLTRTLEHPFTWILVTGGTLLGILHSYTMQNATDSKVWI